MMGHVFFRSITDAFIAPSAVYSHDLSSAAIIIIKVMGCRISISRGNETVCPFNNISRQMNKKTANKRLVNYLNKLVYM